jgi:hypothetical protein
MKIVYTHENPLFVHNAKNVLISEDIAVIVKNEYLSGGMGDLAPLDTWLELWVINDEDYLRALTLLTPTTHPSAQKIWRCTHCRENNEPTFDLCWNCQMEP